MTLRSMWRHKVRSGLTILGIVMAIAAIVGLGSVSEGINSLVTEQLKFASGFISIQEAGQQSMSQQGPPGLNSRVEISVIDDIKEIEGVKSAIPQIFALSTKNRIFVVGVPLDNLDYFNLQNIQFKDGGWPGDGTKEVVLGYKLAESKGLSSGDTIQLGGDEYSINGVLEELNNFIDFGSIASYESVAETFDLKDYASFILVEPYDLSDTTRIASEIEERYDNLKASTPDEQAKTASDAISSISFFTLGIGIVASIVASIGIINTMIMVVLERKREFGIMKALGAERLVILSLVVQEAAVLGIIGGIIGVLLGYGMSQIVNLASAFPIAAVSSRLAIAGFTYSVMLAILAALYPAYQAIKVDAVEAMREE